MSYCFFQNASYAHAVQKSYFLTSGLSCMKKYTHINLFSRTKVELKCVKRIDFELDPRTFPHLVNS